jgi:hypothetical protein
MSTRRRRSNGRRRRPRSPVAVIGAVGLVIMATVTASVIGYDVATVSDQHRAEASLRTVQRNAGEARATLSATRTEIASTVATLHARQQAELQASAQSATVRQNLTATSQTVGLQGLDIAVLNTCLTGVSAAVAASVSGNRQGAVNSITSASTACRTLDGSDAGLSYPFDFPDPFVLTVGNEYFAFATNSAAGNIQIIRSSDLTNWTTVGDALPHLPAWAEADATWGPSVLQRGDTWVLYYSAVYAPTGEQCISDAVASQPQGPYVDSSTSPLECQTALGGSMDPSPFVAPDGTPYLTWKSQGANGLAATLWSEQLTPAGTALVAGAPSPLLAPSQSWEGGVVEGPDMVVSGGQYLLFYSANIWETARYAIGVTNCSGPLGPCTASAGSPLLASQAGFSGPGGPSVLTDGQGRLWLAFHAWLPGKVGPPNSRDLFLRRIDIVGGLAQLTP